MSSVDKAVWSASGGSPFQAISMALAAVDASRRTLPDGLSPTAGMYLEGAFGSLLHARDVLRQALERDLATSWRAAIPEAGLVQSGEACSSLSATVHDASIAWPGGPDLGADLVRSPDVAIRAVRPGYSALLASALAEHRWLHLASAVSWTASWPAADALVRAVNGGRSLARVDHLAMRGTIDGEVARTIAALGWRRISSPMLPEPP